MLWFESLQIWFDFNEICVKFTSYADQSFDEYKKKEERMNSSNLVRTWRSIEIDRVKRASIEV